jgi:hypothetical protein
MKLSPGLRPAEEKICSRARMPATHLWRIDIVWLRLTPRPSGDGHNRRLSRQGTCQWRLSAAPNRTRSPGRARCDLSARGPRNGDRHTDFRPVEATDWKAYAATRCLQAPSLAAHCAQAVSATRRIRMARTRSSHEIPAKGICCASQSAQLNPTARQGSVRATNRRRLSVRLARDHHLVDRA